MATLEEDRQTILEIYAEMGQEPSRLTGFREEDMATVVTRQDGTITRIRRKALDDYRDSGDQSAKRVVEEALEFGEKGR